MENNPVVYERDDRSDSFRMIGDIIAAVAENYNIDVDRITRARWRDTLGLLREFDTLVDDLEMPTKQALSELQTFIRFKKNYPNLGPPSIDAATHKRMVQRVEVILEHGRKISSTSDIEEFVHNRREEVYHTAELLADCASSDTTTQPGFYTAFMPTLRTMGGAANFIDTMLDYNQDKKEGKVSIEASVDFYRTLGANALAEFGQASHILISPGIIRQFYDMSVMRLKNRIKHGKRPYSSLRNIRP